MEIGWTVTFVTLIIQFFCHGCFSLNFEGLALCEFRSRVEIDPSGALQNWDTRDPDPCSWRGVHCISGRVDILNLRGLNLVGSLSPELGKLTHLKALVLSMNNFYGEIPKEIRGLSKLELLDLSSNDLRGEILLEISELPSLKCLLLCGNNFNGGTPSWIKKNTLHCDLKIDSHNLPCEDTVCDNWLELQENSLHGQDSEVGNSKTIKTFIQPLVRSLAKHRRQLIQKELNFPASYISAAPFHAAPVPTRGSGFFAAVPSTNTRTPRLRSSSWFFDENEESVKKDDYFTGTSWHKLIFTVIPSTAIILVICMVLFVAYRRRTAEIGPWRSGLSCQLQNAFITGVPKMNIVELETACEEFTNIIMIYPSCIVYKGILSSGVEVAVVSTNIMSSLDWSERSELQFRMKIDTISRINSKNFVNLLGYCEEEEPFIRMMVFEFVPSGTLFDFLHDVEYEHLEWNSRMRIVMGIAYGLQHMHSLSPPVAHPILQSKSIYITEDLAAKIADVGIFSEPIGKGEFSRDYGKDSLVHYASPETNIYSFGILLLEIVSGRMPISEEDELHILDWAACWLKSERNIKALVDPSLKYVNEDELKALCKVAKACISDNPKSRPTMQEVSDSLRAVLDISPQAAMPQLSPLWWAELEILSMDTT